MAGLEDDIDEDDIGLTLAEVHELLKLAASDKQDKTHGRMKLLARLKEAGVSTLKHRQALASAALTAKKNGRLRPKKPSDPADDAAAPAATSSAAAPAAMPPAAAPPAAEPPAAAPVEESPAFSAGQCVKLVALLSRADLNGKVGEVLEPKNERGRCTVKVQGETIALKPENLVVAAPATVDVS